MPFRRRGLPTVVAVALAAALAASGCGGSSKSTSPPAGVSWPAPDDPMARTRAAGLVPETAERLTYHVHAHLDVFVNGQKVTVPAGIGIDTANPGVHQFTTAGRPSYGGIDPPCETACISPLHTHDVTGVLHTESATKKNNTLGQFFTEWGMRLDADCVATFCRPATEITVYVDGKKYAGDPAKIPLSNRKEIAIVVGSPPASVPSTGDFSQA